MPIKTDPEPLKDPLWERQENETDRAWGAFKEYRDAGPERQIRKLCKQRGHSEKWAHVWAKKWSWRLRVIAWDNHLDAETRDAQVQTIRKMNENQAAVGRSMIAVGGAVVKRFIKRIKDGEDLSDVSLTEARKLIEAGAKLERLATGMPTEIEMELGELTDRQLAALAQGKDPRLVGGDPIEDEEGPGEEAVH